MLRDGVDSYESLQIQRVFDEHGPERDRHTEWWRCQDQPWARLAEILVGAR